MKKIELKSRKLLRTLFGCLSFTAVAFVFQACYGTPEPSYDVKLTGTVRSQTTNLPIKGIKVAVNNGNNYHYTDTNGTFEFYIYVNEWDYYNHEDSTTYTPGGVRVHFSDIDGDQNGLFADTAITIKPDYKDEIKINVALREIE